MTEPLVPRFTAGTHRLASPEQTMARIEPVLGRCGITRIAELTRLDEDLGVPTYTAIRPGGLVLQSGSGKGLTRAAARVSAAMEAIELHHAENPERSRLVRASLEDLRGRGLPACVPRRDDADRRFFHSDRHVIDWVRGEDLVAGAAVWIPASAAFFIEPTIYRTSTNGLASGNHIVEATLHGLLELIERDAIAQVVRADVLDIRGRCRVVDPASVDDERLREIIAKIGAAGSQLVLLWVPASAPVHALWALLLDPRSHHAGTALVTGAGAHPDLCVATARAITEAVQSRLTIVHGARDDIIERPSFTREQLGPGRVSRYFAGLVPDTRWAQLREAVPEATAGPRDLREVLAGVLAGLAGGGHALVVRVDLRRAEHDVPVVKVIAPSLAYRRELS